jgi:nitrogen regulatory protein P-II 1
MVLFLVWFAGRGHRIRRQDISTRRASALRRDLLRFLKFWRPPDGADLQKSAYSLFRGRGTEYAVKRPAPRCTWRKKGKMKLIIAYIQPERLNAVKQALFAREIYKMSVTNALGCGKQGGYLHLYRGAVEEVTLHKKMRLAIAVNDNYIDKTIDAIVEGARTGDIGDGKIFVLPMDECVRIRTGERGPAAIG